MKRVGLFAFVLLFPATRAAAVPMVFFDWDSAAISAQAAAILDNMVHMLKAGEWRVDKIKGSADRSGPASYNRHLSRRRAKAVMRYLLARGAPGGPIEIVGLGETAPLVETPDGVHEPQNRYVLIEFAPSS
jgi:outer membrane protein OmpA-like peptidoglycan-associated protein